MTLRVDVKPELLRWAYERAGLDDDAADDRFEHLRDWVSGEAKPTLKQLEKFARAVHVPIGFLFLAAPPVERVPIPDFRTLADRPVRRSSPDLLDTVYLCQQRQEWYRDFARIQGTAPLEFVGAATTASDVVETAAAIRAHLHFSVEERAGLPTWSDALRRFIEQADSAGVLVMINGIVGSNTSRKLDYREFRGFALADPLAPLVFINGADSKSAQMFTLAHEIAHLWLGESALSDAGADASPTNRVERWCNQVAAELLVPLESIRRAYRESAGIAPEVHRLARQYKVSTLVILRRLHDSGALTRTQLAETYAAEVARLQGLVNEGGGGDFYRTQAVRVGKRFARALIVSTLEGQTLHRDAFRLLGFSKLSTFRELGERLGVT
ncbi:ImmA/IrrE family metallo-endopeptidase [soil metagenome]